MGKKSINCEKTYRPKYIGHILPENFPDYGPKSAFKSTTNFFRFFYTIYEILISYWIYFSRTVVILDLFFPDSSVDNYHIVSYGHL